MSDPSGAPASVMLVPNFLGLGSLGSFLSDSLLSTSVATNFSSIPSFTTTMIRRRESVPGLSCRSSPHSVPPVSLGGKIVGICYITFYLCLPLSIYEPGIDGPFAIHGRFVGLTVGGI